MSKLVLRIPQVEITSVDRHGHVMSRHRVSYKRPQQVQEVARRIAIDPEHLSNVLKRMQERGEETYYVHGLHGCLSPEC
jgi:DNA-binding MarR family transcriptional regulator